MFAEPPAPITAPAAPEGEAEIGARLRVLLAEAQDPSVSRPAEQAKLALGRAQDPKTDAAARERALGIARAALALAEARSLLLAERGLTQHADARVKSAKARLTQARTGGARP